MPRTTLEAKMIKQTFMILLLAFCTSVASFSFTGRGPADPSQVEQKVAEHAEQISKDIKEHSFRLQMELFELNKLLGSNSGAVNEFIEARVKEHDAREARFKTQQEDIQTAHEDYVNQSRLFDKHRRNLQYAVLWMQLAIIAVAVASLTEKKVLWYAGVLSALAGIGYLANGYLLWI